MESSPAPWVSALRHSHNVLQGVVEPLTADQLEQRSYASEWSIAQVLSHLGSQAEIFGLFLDAGLSGQDAPGMEAFGPIWEVWNAKSPQAQAADALRADAVTLARFEAMDEAVHARLRLQVFGMDADTTVLARMRLGELAVHSWDVAVALDPAATITPPAIALLIDTLEQLVNRAAQADGKPRKVRVTTSDPERHFILETGDSVSLVAADDETAPELGLSELRLPAEAFVRLVYGRLDPDHTPPVENAGVELDELRTIFPGF